MLADDFGDCCDLGAGDGIQELVVVFDADLLYAVQVVPAKLNDIVQLIPVIVVVKVTSGFCSNAPDVVE